MDVNTLLIGIGAILATIVIYYVKGIMASIAELPILLRRFEEMLKDFKSMIEDHNKLTNDVRVVEKEIEHLNEKVKDLEHQVRAINALLAQLSEASSD